MAAAWGGGAPHSLSEYYYNASTLPVPGIPVSGNAISLSQFVGKKIFTTSGSVTISNYDGYSLSCSGDGSTIAVSDIPLSVGTVYIFVRNADGTYSQQTYIKLTNSNTSFGHSVALSKTGDTLGVVEYGNNNNGGVYLYQRDGTSYTQQQRIGFAGLPGVKVSLSGDANTLLAMASTRAILYRRTDTSTLFTIGTGVVTSGLTGTGGSVSEDGTTVAIGYTTSGQKHQVIVVTYDDGGTELNRQTISDTALTEFGAGLALSKNGNTLVIGAPQAPKSPHSANGAIYIYERSEAGTYEQKHTLSPLLQSNAKFGFHVSINSDGTVVTASTPGMYKTYVLVRPKNGTTWTEQVTLSQASVGAVSADGGTIVTSASNSTNQKIVRVY